MLSRIAALLPLWQSVIGDADSLQRFIGKWIRPGSPLAAAGWRFSHRCKLEFRRHFQLHAFVPADDQLASLAGVGSSAQHGAIAFTTTHWSVVRDAQGQ